MLKYRFPALATAALGAALALGHPAGAGEFIIVQSTTSTQNSGLYDVLLPQFTAQSGIEVRVVAVGTGQAIKNARNCDGDVLLVHARAAEEAFVAAGYGVVRSDVMYNDFVIVGPPADTAGLAGSHDVLAALAAIKGAGAPFASRGDDSGTNKKELALWKAAGIDPSADSGGWYRETGSGMGATLNVALGMGAYTMTDRATWIAFGNKGDFAIMVEGDAALFNQYGVILVNPERCPNVKAAAGQAFAGASGPNLYEPNTTDWLGRWRLSGNRGNDYRIDRGVQRAGRDGGVGGSYTGIETILLQDQAITESMGVSVDRTKEHLGTTDAMVIKTRRRLIAAAKALRDHGTTPPGVDEPRLYQVRSGGSVVLPKAADWLEGTEELRLAFARRELEPATPLA